MIIKSILVIATLVVCFYIAYILTKDLLEKEEKLNDI